MSIARMIASATCPRGDVMMSNQASTMSSAAAAADATARYRECRIAKYPVAPSVTSSSTSNPTHAML